MSVNSSSSFRVHCSDVTAAGFVSVAFVATRASVFLPLSWLVFGLGLRRWRRRRSFQSTSHSDIFTYHLLLLELLFVLAAIFYFAGQYAGRPELVLPAVYATAIVYPGQTLFHLLTCVERYLAVVHPVVYLGLRRSRGVRLRNASIAGAWLLSLGWVGFVALSLPDMPYVSLCCLLAVVLVAISFCSLRVLHALNHPGPGDVGGDRARLDQSKQRAFCTITAILGVQLLWFAAQLIGLALNGYHLLSYGGGCLLLVTVNWLNLPCTAASPLLCLHRAGKLKCCTRG